MVIWDGCGGWGVGMPCVATAFFLRRARERISDGLVTNNSPPDHLRCGRISICMKSRRNPSACRGNMPEKHVFYIVLHNFPQSALASVKFCVYNNLYMPCKREAV